MLVLRSLLHVHCCTLHGARSPSCDCGRTLQIPCRSFELGSVGTLMWRAGVEKMTKAREQHVEDGKEEAIPLPLCFSLGPFRTPVLPYSLPYSLFLARTHTRAHTLALHFRRTVTLAAKKNSLTADGALHAATCVIAQGQCGTCLGAHLPWPDHLGADSQLMAKVAC